MEEVLDIIHVFRGQLQNRGPVIFCHPAPVVTLQSTDVFIRHALFHLSAAPRDSLLERSHRTGKIDEKIGGIYHVHHYLIEVPVRLVLVFRHTSLTVEVEGEDLRILVDRPVLHDRLRTAVQLAMDPELVREKVHLGMEGPALHVAVEQGKKWIYVIRFEKWLEIEMLTQKIDDTRFSRPHVTGDCDVFSGHLASLPLLCKEGPGEVDLRVPESTPPDLPLQRGGVVYKISSTISPYNASVLTASGSQISILSQFPVTLIIVCLARFKSAGILSAIVTSQMRL